MITESGTVTAKAVCVSTDRLVPRLHSKVRLPTKGVAQSMSSGGKAGAGHYRKTKLSYT